MSGKAVRFGLLNVHHRFELAGCNATQERLDAQCKPKTSRNVHPIRIPRPIVA